jgi:hypothetical protein
MPRIRIEDWSKVVFYTLYNQWVTREKRYPVNQPDANKKGVRERDC